MCFFLEEGAAGSELADGYGCAGVTILAKKDFHSTGWTPYQLAHLMVKQKVEMEAWQGFHLMLPSPRFKHACSLDLKPAKGFLPKQILSNGTAAARSALMTTDNAFSMWG